MAEGSAFSDIINTIKTDLDSSLLKNPKFEDIFSKELNYYYYKTKNLNIDVKVSFDKKSVSITSFDPVLDCTIPEFRGKNKAYINTKFYLKDDNMYVEYAQGVLFDKEELKKNGMLTSSIYESKFETLYSLKCYNKYGIEYSNSSYSDVYPLSQKVDDINVSEQTQSSFHKPTFNEFKLPKPSIHVLNAIVRNTYRKEGSLSIIHANNAIITSDGYKDVACSLFTTHFMFPDMLRGDRMIAKAEEFEGKYVFTIDEKYAATIEEGYEKAKKELAEKLYSEEIELSEEQLDYLKNNI